MSSKLTEHGPLRERLLSHYLEDDFHDYNTGDKWTSIISNSGTVSCLTGTGSAGGILALVASDGTVADNDESYVKSTTSPFLFAGNKPISLIARVQWTEANTNAANMVVAVANAVAAEFLIDDAGGLPTNFYGFAAYKVDGGTTGTGYWKCIASFGTTQYTATSTNAAGGSSYQTIKITWLPNNATSGDSQTIFEIDPLGGDAFQPMVDSNNKPIVLRSSAIASFGSPVAMQAACGVKNGSGSLETLNVDFIFASQRR